jgi:hypothetical protein
MWQDPVSCVPAYKRGIGNRCRMAAWLSLRSEPVQEYAGGRSVQLAVLTEGKV